MYPVLKIDFDTLNPKPLRMSTRDVHISKGCVIKSEVDDDWRELVSTNIGPPFKPAHQPFYPSLEHVKVCQI